MMSIRRGQGISRDVDNRYQVFVIGEPRDANIKARPTRSRRYILARPPRRDLARKGLATDARSVINDAEEQGK